MKEPLVKGLFVSSCFLWRVKSSFLILYPKGEDAMSLFTKIFLAVLWLALTSGLASAAQSMITEAEGYSCLGEDKSKRQTEQSAFAEAKRKAGEFAVTHLKSETLVKDFELEKDIVEAYMNASIKVLQELEKGWYKDASMGECYRVKIKAEVTPEEKMMAKADKGDKALDDPTAPLKVKVWPDKKDYKKGEKIRIYIKGNKPFYARIIYNDAGGNQVQLLPNPYRAENYFNGGVVYQMPSGTDRFDLEVSPPFGQESITVYASTAPLGDIELKQDDAVYRVVSSEKEVSEMTRGVKIMGASAKDSQEGQTAEFAEEKATVTTK